MFIAARQFQTGAMHIQVLSIRIHDPSQLVML